MSQKKKSRPNPARRRTAKSKLDPQNASLGTANGSSAAAGKPAVHQEKNAAWTTSDSQCQAKRAAGVPRRESSTVKQGSAVIKPKTANTQPNGSKNSNAKGDSSNSWTGSLALATPAFVTGGLVGCAAGAAVLLSAGLWKDFGGVESAILAARTAKLCMDNLCEEIITSLKAGTYSAPEALDMLRRTTLAYATAIPGGAPFVERMFREIDMVRKQRGREVDKVVAETYTELSRAGKRGAGPAEMHTIIIRSLVKLSEFTSRATQDIIARNPKLRPYGNGAAKALRPQPEPKPKVPTVKLNMAINHKQAVGA